MLILTGLAATSALGQVGPPPLITVQPVDLSVPKGGTAVFFVVAVSGTTPTYKWKRNGGYISGATQSTLTITNVSNGDKGTYRVEVSNASAMATSSLVQLEVLKRAPIISTPSMTGLGFNMQFQGDNGDTLVIHASTNGVTWSPIYTNSFNSSGILNFTDTQARNFSGRFYRAEVR